MTTLVEARGPGIRAWFMLIGCEARMVVRDAPGLIVPLALPLLILLTSAAGAARQEIADGMTAMEVFVLPLVLVMVVSSIGVLNMPGFLAYYRRSGILRRLAVTPASPMMVLAAQAVVSVVQALIGIAAALTVAVAVFGANLPARPAWAAGVAVLTIAAMYSLGMTVAAVAPTPNSAVAIGLVLFFALGALGGMFGGPGALPGPLADLGGWLPFGAAVSSLGAAWVGTAPDAGALIGLAVTTLVGVSLSAAFFRWE